MHKLGKGKSYQNAQAHATMLGFKGNLKPQINLYKEKKD